MTIIVGAWWRIGRDGAFRRVMGSNPVLAAV